MKKQFISLPKVKHLYQIFSKSRCHSAISFLLLLSILNLTSGCARYFKINSYTRAEGTIPDKFEELKNQNKYFIVYLDGDVWRLYDIIIDEDKSALTASTGTLDFQRFKYLRPNPEKNHSYRMQTENWVLQEVHVYVSEYSFVEGSDVIIPFSGIDRIDVNRPAVGAAIGVTILVVGLATLAAAGLLYLGLKSWAAQY